MSKLRIRPNDNWRWYFDEQYDCLMLELSYDMLFRSRYPSKMLTQDAFGRFSFSVDDTSAYYQFYENSAELALSEPKKIELVLNGIVATNFLKPQMPKSWYFAQQPMCFTPSFAEVVEAIVQDSGQRINLLVVEAGQHASLCLIAEENLDISGKIFTAGDVLKVMNDRLASKRHYHQDNNPETMDENQAIANLFYQVCS